MQNKTKICMLSFTTRIILLFLAFHVIVEAIAACIMLKNRDKLNDRARKCITVFFITSAIASLVEIFLVIVNPLGPNAYRLIDTKVILCGFLIFALLMFYCVELLRPHWLNAKRIFYIMLPWLLLVVALIIGAVYGKQILVIHTIEQLGENLFQPDVFIRLLLILLFVPYAIWLFVIDFNWRHSSVSRKTTNIIVAMTIILCFTYIGSRGLQFFYAYVAHELVYVLITLFLVRLECKERLSHATCQYTTSPSKPKIVLSDNTMEHLVNALDEVISNPDVWQNPDITINDIARIVGTNRTYLQVAAKYKGYLSAMDMIHHIRIEYVCEQLRTVSSPQIQNIFYDAGYRSRTTAWRNFVNIMGCTPTEFEKTYLSTPPQKGSKIAKRLFFAVFYGNETIYFRIATCVS